MIGQVKFAFVASLPLSFCIACSIESVAATVPAPEVYPVKTLAITGALVRVVTLPTEVTSPVKFALVVTFQAVSQEAVPVRLVATPEEGVPSAPPFTTTAPAVPTFTHKAVKTHVQGAVTDKVQAPPEVVTKPLVVKLESVAIFWEVFTEKAFAVRVSPVPAVYVPAPAICAKTIFVTQIVIVSLVQVH